MADLLRTIIDWEHKLAIRRTTVLFVTLWTTVKSFQWAGDYAMAGIATNGVEAAAIIAAVTAPVALLQAAVFKTYIEGKAL